jgi:hypothetical protein
MSCRWLLLGAQYDYYDLHVRGWFGRDASVQMAKHACMGSFKVVLGGLLVSKSGID